MLAYIASAILLVGGWGALLSPLPLFMSTYTQLQSVVSWATVRPTPELVVSEYCSFCRRDYGPSREGLSTAMRGSWQGFLETIPLPSHLVHR